MQQPFHDAMTEATRLTRNGRVAEATELRLGVENTGTETIPDLAVTIFIDDGTQGSFNIRLDQPGLANPNRPVWVLEDKYPRLAGESRPLGTAPGDIAAANTFGVVSPRSTVTPSMAIRSIASAPVSSSTAATARIGSP